VNSPERLGVQRVNQDLGGSPTHATQAVKPCFASAESRIGRARCAIRAQDALATSPPGLDIAGTEEGVGDVRIVRLRRVASQELLHRPAFWEFAGIPDQ